jgi:hypothetical protein
LSAKRQGELTGAITRLNPEFRRSDTGVDVDGFGRDVVDDGWGAVLVVNVMMMVDGIGGGPVVVDARRGDLIVNVHRL